MSNFDSCLIIERMKQIEKMKEDKELAITLEVQAGTLSKWKTRNSLPIETILSFAHSRNISLDWLISGKESSPLDGGQQMALLAFNALPPEKKLDAITFMSNLKTGTTNGMNQHISGDHNQANQQVIHGNVSEVNGFNKSSSGRSKKS